MTESGPRLAGSSTDRASHIAAALHGTVAKPEPKLGVRRRLRRTVWTKPANAVGMDDRADTKQHGEEGRPMPRSEAQRRKAGAVRTEPATIEVMTDTFSEHAGDGKTASQPCTFLRDGIG